MPLFECSKCHCIENTACSNYWVSKDKFCSECDPKIGKWHGRFEKQSAVGLLIGNDGFLYYSEEGLEWRMEHQGFKIIGKVSVSEKEKN